MWLSFPVETPGNTCRTFLIEIAYDYNTNLIKWSFSKSIAPSGITETFSKTCYYNVITIGSNRNLSPSAYFPASSFSPCNSTVVQPFFFPPVWFSDFFFFVFFFFREAQTQVAAAISESALVYGGRDFPPEEEPQHEPAVLRQEPPVLGRNRAAPHGPSKENLQIHGPITPLLFS